MAARGNPGRGGIGHCLYPHADGVGQLPAAGNQLQDLRRPTPIDEAVRFIDELLYLSGVQLAELGPEWKRLRQLCLDKNLGGNNLPGAWLVAAVARRGEHLVSFDRDYRKLMSRSQFTLLVGEAKDQLSQSSLRKRSLAVVSNRPIQSFNQTA